MSEDNYNVIKSSNAIIKMWTKHVGVESQAIDQLRNIASLPFIFKHVAAMPDVHLGMGATVGSVIATKGAVIPAAVGVDIGCFTLNTEVELVNGVIKTFADLIEMDKAGEEIYGYALDTSSNRICMTKYQAPRKTRETSSTVKITLDNKKTIECTVDHIFYKRDGSEIRADQLASGISLMPLYSDTDENVNTIETGKFKDVSGYDVIYQPGSNSWSYAHRLADEYNSRNNLTCVPLEKSWCRHHVDFIKTNNLPTNVMRVGRKEHWKIHSDNVGANNRKGLTGFKKAHEKHPELFSKMASDNLKNLHKDTAFAERRNKRALEQINKLNKNPTEGMLAWRENPHRPKVNNNDVGIKTKQQLGKIRKIVDYIAAAGIDKITKEVWNTFRLKVYNGKTWDNVCEFMISEGLTEINGLAFELNHTVTSVEFIQHDIPIDVYCLTSPEYNTFALAAGVFVHNCGMNAVRLSITATDLPDNLKDIRAAIEDVVPVGFAQHQYSKVSNSLQRELNEDLDRLVAKHPIIKKMTKNIARKTMDQAGTLGGGNHFIELCLDENDDVWVMLHSGSRGVGNIIGRYFIQLAKADMEKHFISLPDKDLSYFVEGTSHYDDYCEWVEWAQRYAKMNREIMMNLVLATLGTHLPQFVVTQEAINCHHNYISKENHFGSNVNVTRKGAVRAREGDLGIIPGSMGAKSFIVRGKGNCDSFHSCSHGAGRSMSRSEAKRRFTADDQVIATQGVECRKDDGVVDEIPYAYKDIEAVMKSQEDLVSIVHTLKQVICVKG